MSHILSAADIDARLSVVADGGRAAAPLDPAAPVVRYDFRRPDRINKEQLLALHFLHDRCARNMSTSLSAYLRTTTTMTVLSVDQRSYADFLASLADPTAYYALAIAPFNELGAIEINPAIAFPMIDRILGGSGQPIAINRPLTAIEQNVVDSVVKLLLEGLGETWNTATSLTFSIRGRETRPQMLPVAAPNEVVLAVVFEVRVGDIKGLVSLCIPATIVEAAGAHFSQAWQRQRREFSPIERAWLSQHLGRVAVPVVPQIRTRLSASAVLSLQPGEILALPLGADRPLDVYVGNVRKLSGRLAAEQGRLMVMVQERLTSDAIHEGM
jgi:flagellar motor switch protein FliM